MELRKKRILYFDFIKVVAIFLVCFYHAQSFQLNYLDESSTGIYVKNFIVSFASMGVPLFFIVNGALMLKKDLDLKKHIKKLIKVSVITIVWIILTLGLTAIICDIPYDSLKAFIYDCFYWPSGTLNHIWFLFAIIHIYMLYPLIKILMDKNNKQVIIYFLIVIFIFTFGNSVINNFRHGVEFILNKKIIESVDFNYFNRFNLFYETYAYAVLYFILGGALSLLVKKELIKKQKIIGLTVLLFSFNGISLIHSIMVSKIHGYRYDPVWNGYETISTMIMSIIFFIIAFKLENKLERINKWITLIGNNTLGIYLIHMLLLFKFKPIFSSTNLGNSILGNLIFTTFILIFSLIVTLIVKKVPIINKIFDI